jgi:hypothetical protein
MTPYCKSLNGVLAIENNIFGLEKTSGLGLADNSGKNKESCLS